MTAPKKHPLLEVGPGPFFDMEDILDESSLDIKLNRDEVIHSEARPGSRVRIIDLTFTSQADWHGIKWSHRATIYTPPDYSGPGDIGIIGAKWQDFEPDADRAIIPELMKGTMAEFAEGTALDLGLPIMAFSLPGEDINGMHESDLMGWAYGRMLQTGDLTWYCYHPLAQAYLRAITLARKVLDLNQVRAVLMGCSKRGAAISLAAGVDPDRIVGVMNTCFHGGNMLYMAALKFLQFGREIGGPAEERTGPGYIPGPDLLRSFNNPVGLAALIHFDPYLWPDQIKPAFLVVLGTNDEFFGLGSPNEMMNALKGDKAFLAVDNTDHTFVSAKHLLAWRMWLEHSFRGRPVPEISLTAERTGPNLTVRSRVTSQLPIEEVDLFYARNKGLDWRFATWESKPMSDRDDEYQADLEVKDGWQLSYYVQVRDTQGGLVSSLIETL